MKEQKKMQQMRLNHTEASQENKLNITHSHGDLFPFVSFEA